MDISAEKKQQIFRQVREVFSDVDTDNLRLLCERNNWILEKCIDACLTASVSKPTIATPSNKTNFFKNNQFPRASNTSKYAKSKNSTDIGAAEEHRIGELIRAGYKVMILMRGAPGSGKSFLARKILREYVSPWNDYSEKDFIFSSDDYFYDRYGNYRYHVSKLSEAHEFNQRNTEQKAKNGASPIIIDNTNLQLWEMMIYVKYALQYGYLVEILEPRTPWHASAGKLAMKNSHNVPKEKIQRMLDKYEKGNVEDLMKMAGGKNYEVPLPQMRNFPPIIAGVVGQVEEPPGVEGEVQTTQVEYENSLGAHAYNNVWTSELPPPAPPQNDKLQNWNFPLNKSQSTPEWGSYETNEAKPQRQRKRQVGGSSYNGLAPESYQANSNFVVGTDYSSQIIEEPVQPAFDTVHTYSGVEAHAGVETFQPLNTNATVGSSYSAFHAYSAADTHAVVDNNIASLDDEIALFYKSINSDSPVNESNPKTACDPPSANKQTKSLLDLLREDMPETQVADKSSALLAERETFKRHSINCSNENGNFITLRQMYPNRNVNALWDLFSHCNGDIDWAVDILIRENDEDIINGKKEEDDVFEEIYECDCGKAELVKLPANVATPGAPKCLVQRKKGARVNKQGNEDVQGIRRDLESRFVLSDDLYSEHTRKIRNLRNGVADLGTGIDKMSVDSESQIIDMPDSLNGEADTEGDDDDDDDDDDRDNQHLLEMTLNDDLVKQLHAEFKDEIALSEALPANKKNKVFLPRKLAKELYMVWAEAAYNELEERRQDIIREDERFARLLKNPKYTHLRESPCNTQEILDWEMAAQLQKEEEEEIPPPSHAPTHLAAHLTQMKLMESFPNIPRETLLDILSSSNYKYDDTVKFIRTNIDDQKEEKQDAVIKIPEQKIEAKPTINRVQQLITFHSIESLNLAHDQVYANLTLEEAKHLALRKFEEARNQAAHYCQMKAECYAKSQEAIQKGAGQVGLYYSQIANMHKGKIEHLNHLAASFIMDAHKFSQNNPDLLDLHYLFVPEAVSCVDLFLDRHITALRKATNSRKQKDIFIITGRGLHSTGGVATIKNKVKGRLKDRGLRWAEVNPGLLKVKIHQASRHSKHLE